MSFKAFRQFNHPGVGGVPRLRGRLDENLARFFTADTVLDRLASGLAARRVLPMRELLESAEFFERVRRRLRSPVVADLCCGHGLVGLLFALLEPGTERVVLIDRRRPKSFATLLEVMESIVPGIRGKIAYVEERLRPNLPELSDVSSIVAVHACGARTDRCLEIAVARALPIAVMPCCYSRTADRAPRALRDSLGAVMATDVDRTYRLERAGYRVAWSAIPASITAHHRVIVAQPPPPLAPPVAPL